MNFKKNNRVYLTTTDSRTYKILHLAHEDLCCMGCVNRRRRNSYCRLIRKGKVETKWPSWKLVSKNKKQWMKKPLKFKPTKFLFSNYWYTQIDW